MTWFPERISVDLPRQDKGASGGYPAWEGQEGSGGMLHEMQETAQC